MRRTLEDYRSAHVPANQSLPEPEVRVHFLGPKQEAALRWRGFGAVIGVSAILLVGSILLG